MKKCILIILFTSVIQSQWLTEVRLTNDPAMSTTTINNGKYIATNGSTIHIVWYDKRNGDDEIYYKRSTDAGISWSSDIRLTNSTGFSEQPTIFVVNSSVRVVWRDTRHGDSEIYYKQSSDGGITWGNDIRITNAPFRSSLPSIIVQGLNEHIVWNDHRDDPQGTTSEIYYKRSTDGGVNWSGDVRLTNAIYDSYYPSMALSGSSLHIVWDDERNLNNSEIYYKNSTDGGSNWGPDMRLTNISGESTNPCIVASGLNLHVVWDDEIVTNEEIFYKRSTDGGVTWGSDNRLTNAIRNSWAASLIISGQSLHIVWYDDRDSFFKIYYKKSTNDGITWEPDLQLTNDSTGGSSRPSIAVSGSQLNVAWMDNRDGNWEIYYKQNPTGVVNVNNISSVTPVEYILSQNYPNPFNPTTKINFSIIKTSYTKLIVYDVLGKEIASLVNEELNPGIYEVDFNASNFVSSVLFYRLSSGDFVDTKRMILVK